MNEQLRECKQAIRNFMQAHITDERLVMLLAHARDGKLSFTTCCCFIGTATAIHALQGFNPVRDEWDWQHLNAARRLVGSKEAEQAFARLGEISNAVFAATWSDKDACNDELYSALTDPARRRRLIPIIRAEMKRREHEHTGAGLGNSVESIASSVPA